MEFFRGITSIFTSDNYKSSYFIIIPKEIINIIISYIDTKANLYSILNYLNTIDTYYPPTIHEDGKFWKDIFFLKLRSILRIDADDCTIINKFYNNFKNNYLYFLDEKSVYNAFGFEFESGSYSFSLYMWLSEHNPHFFNLLKNTILRYELELHDIDKIIIEFKNCEKSIKEIILREKGIDIDIHKIQFEWLDCLLKNSIRMGYLISLNLLNRIDEINDSKHYLNLGELIRDECNPNNNHNNFENLSEINFIAYNSYLPSKELLIKCFKLLISEDYILDPTDQIYNKYLNNYHIGLDKDLIIDLIKNMIYHIGNMNYIDNTNKSFGNKYRDKFDLYLQKQLHRILQHLIYKS